MTNNSFVISDVNGRFNSLLRTKDYNSLKQCKSIEDITIKLNQHFNFIDEDVKYKDFRKKFIENLKYELSEFDSKNNNILQYFIEYYKILSFFNKLQNISANPLGDFDELKSIELCKTFKDVEKLCIKNCFLKEYFENLKDFLKDNSEKPISEINCQKIHCKIIKIHIDKYYNKNNNTFLKEILEIEGNRQILEICLNGKNLPNKIEFFPEATTFNKKELIKLSKATDIEEINRIFNNNSEKDLRIVAMSNILKIYVESFKQLNDISCLYSYFKLKEQEMENVLWITECLVQGFDDKFDEIITFSDD